MAINCMLGVVYSWSIFVVPLSRKFGWSRAQLSWPFTASIFTFVLVAVMAGKWLDKGRPRIVCLTGAIFLGVGFILTSYITSFPALVITYGVIGGAGVGLSYLTCVVTSIRLFPDKKGLAAGITVFGFGLGAFVFTPIAVKPIKGEILRLRTERPPVQPHITWHDSYMVKKPDGLLWTGTTEDEAGFNKEPTEAAAQRIMAGVVRIYPAITNATIEVHTACLRPVTPDNAPIIGPVPGAQGVYIATGGGRKGILAAPAMGKAVAELIVHGKTSLPAGPLGLERFLQG